MRGRPWNQRLAVFLALWAGLFIFVPAAIGLPRALRTFSQWESGMTVVPKLGTGWGPLVAGATGWAIWSRQPTAYLYVPASATTLSLRLVPATCPVGDVMVANVFSGSQALAVWMLLPGQHWYTVSLPPGLPVVPLYHPTTPVGFSFSCVYDPHQTTAVSPYNKDTGAAITGLTFTSP